VAVYRRLNLYDPKVVIIGGYNYLFCWAALFWAKKNTRKVIVINESHYLDKKRLVIKETIKRFFVSKCDAALVDGTRHRDYTIGMGLEPGKIFIKHGTGPVDVSFYQRAVSQFRNNKLELCDKLGISYKNFLFVGRFSPEKNIIFLIKAYKRLKEEEAENWGLILVGNGSQKREIEDFICTNRVNDIFIPGFKQREELALFYAISDVFILPSISEPWGLVVNEAMASGLPILVSNRCGCYPDIVQDGRNGFSFDPVNEDELHGLMRSISQGKYNLETMGKASVEIIQEYTPCRAAEKYLKAVNFVMGKDNK
jgi:glycosyltransferase involved in cell wall biosynthesis